LDADGLKAAPDSQARRYMRKNMSIIIEFPNKEQLSYRKTEAWIRSTLGNTNLSPDKINEIVEEFKKYYEELKPSFKSEMKLPANMSLSDQHVDSIRIAYKESTDKIFEYFMKLLASSQHIIIGLLAREKLKK
jgi:hypothetical protein